MKSRYGKYILENRTRKSPAKIAEHLGIREEKVREFLKERGLDGDSPATVRAVKSASAPAFSGAHLPVVVVLLGLLLLGLLVYSNSFGNSFVYDDQFHIVENTAIRSVRNIPLVFTHSLSHFGGQTLGRFYRPLVSLADMFDYRIWKTRPLGYHLTNTALHIAVAALLFVMLLLLAGHRIVAASAALLYLVHPVHVEAVAYISGRADPLATVFLLLMCIFQVKSWRAASRFSGGLYTLAVAVSFAAALLSKESSIVYPFLLAFVEYCFRDRAGYSPIAPRRLVFYAPLIAVAGVWFIVKDAIVKTQAMLAYVLPLETRLLMVPRLIIDYLRVLIFPFGLHMEYKLPMPRSLFDGEYFGHLVLLACLAAAIVYAWRRGKLDTASRVVFFGLGWFIIGLLPFLSIFLPLNAAFSEHWVYIPSMGFFFGMIYLLLSAAGRSSSFKKAAVVIILFVAAVFSLLTVRQNRFWKDDVTFYAYTLRYAPYSEIAHYNLAFEYIKARRFAEAKKHLEAALKINPELTDAAENLRLVDRELAGRGGAVR